MYEIRVNEGDREDGILNEGLVREGEELMGLRRREGVRGIGKADNCFSLIVFRLYKMKL